MALRMGGFAGHQTSSRFSEKPGLRGIGQKVTEQDTQVSSSGLLRVHIGPPTCTHTCAYTTHILSHTYTLKQNKITQQQ